MQRIMRNMRAKRKEKMEKEEKSRKVPGARVIARAQAGKTAENGVRFAERTITTPRYASITANDKNSVRFVNRTNMNSKIAPNMT